jgi:hypothetical protein
MPREWGDPENPLSIIGGALILGGFTGETPLGLIEHTIVDFQIEMHLLSPEEATAMWAYFHSEAAREGAQENDTIFRQLIHDASDPKDNQIAFWIDMDDGSYLYFTTRSLNRIKRRQAKRKAQNDNG